MRELEVNPGESFLKRKTLFVKPQDSWVGKVADTCFEPGYQRASFGYLENVHVSLFTLS
jgi:hypothetical protein